MSNGDDQQEICCILGICCGGQHDRKAKESLAAKMRRELGEGAKYPDKVAAWVIDTFDLAPKGTISAYRDAVAEMAREYDYET